jgi:hypothetical protein
VGFSTRVFDSGFVHAGHVDFSSTAMLKPFGALKAPEPADADQAFNLVFRG